MQIAVTRAVSESLAECELTHLERIPIDIATAVQQHAAYEALLGSLGVTVVRADPAPTYPDAVFVEDTAIVLDEVAVLTQPGALSRRGELPAIASLLSSYRTLLHIDGDATIDGGDVLLLGRTLYVGRSARSNDAGIAALAQLLRQYDYQVVAVDFTGCLHLKSAVTAATDDLLLFNPEWVSLDHFAGYHGLAVDPEEQHAGNILRVGIHLVYPEEFGRTAARLRATGLQLQTLRYGELAKAEGAVTCCSLLFNSH